MYRNNRAGLLNRLYLRLTKYKSLTPYILAQAKLESANFQSSIYQKINNPFGMTSPSKRPSVGYRSDVYEKNSTVPMQGYRNDTQAIKDLLLWMDYTKFPSVVSGADEYARELKKRGYYTSSESDYAKALKSWL